MSATNTRNSSSAALFNLTRCALLAAMAMVLDLFEIPIVAFYKLDLSALPAIIGGFAMGPVQGLAVVVVKNLVRLLRSDSMYVGQIADILMVGSFVLVSSLIYHRRKNQKGALIALIAGTAAMIVASVLVNAFILVPAYQVLMHLDLEKILAMAKWSFIDSTFKLVLFVTAPFNLLKGVVLSVLTYLLYKRVSPLLHQKSSR